MKNCLGIVAFLILCSAGSCDGAEFHYIQRQKKLPQSQFKNILLTPFERLQGGYCGDVYCTGETVSCCSGSSDVCCGYPAGTATCCSSGCFDGINDVCCVDNTACAEGDSCCGEGCCAAGDTCCGLGCCIEGSICCNASCCDAGEVCCLTGCCPAPTLQPTTQAPQPPTFQPTEAPVSASSSYQVDVGLIVGLSIGSCILCSVAVIVSYMICSRNRGLTEMRRSLVQYSEFVMIAVLGEGESTPSAPPHSPPLPVINPIIE